MEDIITSISTYGYIIIALYSFGGGMLGIVGGAILASMGKLDIAVVLLLAGTSNMIGDFFLFYIGKYQKKELNKYTFFKTHRRKMAYSRVLVRKNDVLSIFVQKYLYGVKTLIPIILGLANYNTNKFAIFNILASVLWVSVVGLGTFYSAEVVREFFNTNNIPSIVFPIILLSFMFGVWKFVEYQTEKKRK
jgi:membrane protein DedA with SNARE-associated domain